MKLILLSILLVSTYCNAQVLDNLKLFKCHENIEKSGEKEDADGKAFIMIKEDKLIFLRFNDLLNMKTGEVIIKTAIDTLDLNPTKKVNVFTFILSDKKLKLKVTSENSFELQSTDKIQSYHTIENIDLKSPSIEKCKQFLIGNTFVEIDVTEDNKPTLTRTYQENGKAKYQRIGSKSSWESTYSFIEFQDYVFLKGITSAPILITKLDQNKLIGIKTNYNSTQKIVHFINAKDWINPDSENIRTEKPFEIDPVDISNS
ncbi:MAG: hypothetical protein GQ574_14075 [Crocinitomix sp.]|nr:hypothetical protein [Crocinitomix sp.]